MSIPVIYIFCCIGIITSIMGILIFVEMLVNKTITVKRNRHWKKNMKTTEKWLSSWGA